MTNDPVAAYRELLGTLAEVTRRASEHADRRIVELTAELAEAKRAITKAATNETKVKDEVTDWWRRRVVARLTNLNWISAGPRPIPDPAADPRLLDEYLADIEPTTDRLFAVVAKASRRGYH